MRIYYVDIRNLLHYRSMDIFRLHLIQSVLEFLFPLSYKCRGGCVRHGNILESKSAWGKKILLIYEKGPKTPWELTASKFLGIVTERILDPLECRESQIASSGNVDMETNHWNKWKEDYNEERSKKEGYVDRTCVKT